MKFPEKFLLLMVMVVIIAIAFIYFNPFVDPLKVTNNNTSVVNGLNNNSTNMDTSIAITNVSNLAYNNTDLQMVNSDIIFNSVNWSKYHNIERISVHDNKIVGPNNVINHTFIKFSIDVNVKDPENTHELYQEMAGVVIEIRQMIGPNSSVSIWGLVNGFDRYNVGMLPHEDRIYASDHYHPHAYKNEIYLIPGDDIYDYHSYTLINNSVIEN